MAAVDVLLDRLFDGGFEVYENSRGWMAQCPAHADSGPSLSIAEGDRRMVLIYCFAGCSADSVLHALDLSWSDLASTRVRRLSDKAVGRTRDYNRMPRAGRYKPLPEGLNLTLREYAMAKDLPLDMLKGMALEDCNYGGSGAVRMPYLDENAQVVANRVRLSMYGDVKFRWKNGDDPVLYGLWLMDRAREKGYVVLVEGESDMQTMHFHGEPALGIPGANTWKPSWERHFYGIHTILLWVEPDQGGTALLKALRASELASRVWVVTHPEYKDASEMHLSSNRWDEDWLEMKSDAVSLV